MPPDPPSDLMLPPVSAAEEGALYEQIVEGIRREVSEGRLKPGAALPSFRKSAEQMMVSLITVKRAYEELEREGIIYRKQGLGTFVAPAGGDRSREAKLELARELIRKAANEAIEAGMDEADLPRFFAETLRTQPKTKK
jgi:GntR family transcriptional regulator